MTSGIFLPARMTPVLRAGRILRAFGVLPAVNPLACRVLMKGKDRMRVGMRQPDGIFSTEDGSWQR
jgi:hypothetical protein